MKTILLVLTMLTTASAAPRCISLASLARGVTVQSALEKPIKPFILQGQAARKFERRLTSASDRVINPWRSFTEEAEWLLDEGFESNDKPNQRRLKRLLTYMRANLTNLQTVGFGDDPEWDVYVFGRDRCGNIVGFHYLEVS